MTKLSNPLIGAWHLRSVETKLESGETYRGFGDNSKGLIVYTETGHVTAQVFNPDRPLVEAGDQLKASDEEARINFKGSVAYYGNYEIYHDQNVVIHHVKGSLFRNWEDDVQERLYELKGDLLSLSTRAVPWGDLGTVVNVMTWERATANQPR
jgi:hypothetical protein